ncbi:MAG: preprotein translocase subunit SecE [Armatimonadetes bacterium]|nr:preprotein translocase subunit SecE [Armatimonadota bacterium]MCX7967050.1 preprotein translocase subunit SecE [Armatimonadota bacterium]MDW8142542.1 preprotein translocase subunit SecE [Armatimonadota bacterium]
MLRTKPTLPEAKVRRRAILSGEGSLVARIRQFLMECWAELKLTQRPTKQEVISYSMAVLVVILVSAAYLAVLDFVFARIFAIFR